MEKGTTIRLESFAIEESCTVVLERVYLKTVHFWFYMNTQTIPLTLCKPQPTYLDNSNLLTVVGPSSYQKTLAAENPSDQ